MQFHFIASTGRTATTFLARALDQLDGVIACHEGYRAADKDSPPLLPLINMENRIAFDSAETARKVVAEKRNREILESAGACGSGKVLIDVGYYNCTIGKALLDGHADARMVGIVRTLEPFVRSATATAGEDPLPVGWAAPEKPLTPREKFISFGRIRPRPGSKEAAAWPQWSPIMRNIWLWRETNALLLNAKALHPRRVLLLRFELLEQDSEAFLKRITDHFALPSVPASAASDAARTHRNRKASGYQVGPFVDWSGPEKSFAERAMVEIGASEWLQ